MNDPEEKTRMKPEVEEALNLPELIGTEKQVTFANTLRMKIVDQLYNLGRFNELNEFRIWLINQTDATFWINGKETTAYEDKLLYKMNVNSGNVTYLKTEANVLIYAYRFSQINKLRSSSARPQSQPKEK